MTTPKERDAQDDRDLAFLAATASPALQRASSAYSVSLVNAADSRVEAFRAGWAASREEDVHQDVLRVRLDDLHLDLAAETMYEAMRKAANAQLAATLPAWPDLPQPTRDHRKQQLRNALAVMAATE